MTRATLAATALTLLGVSGPLPATQDEAPSVVALRAGRVHLVAGGEVLENATVVVRDGVVTAVGEELEPPLGAHVVDYGPDAVIVPGLVAAFSHYAEGIASRRTAEPGLRAVDAFDFFRKYAYPLSSGVTTVYVTPAENRLIAGEGALIKLAGEDVKRRVLNESAAIHGAIDASARNAPGYWEPPIPATVDVGMGHLEPQLPKSTMGAIVALDELVEAARSGNEDSEYGAFAVRELRARLDADTPWRVSVVDAREARAILDFAERVGVPLILDRAHAVADLAEAIAEADVPVIYRLPYTPNMTLRNRGKEPDAIWPDLSVPAALDRAGVRIAITSEVPRDLLFAANLALRGGLAPETALRAITLTPAEILGGAERVGSIGVGKDGDFCVLNGDPFSGGATVLATWIDGRVVWEAPTTSAVVIEVDELYLGDGRVLRPGQILMEEGRILAVEERVSRPRGARVVRGKAAMPGIIDAMGHLGLEGSRKVPRPDFKLASIVGPGDEVDRRVAAHGITTVVLSPAEGSKGGAPIMAYKPAAADPERQVVGDPIALRLIWTEPNRLKSGEDVRKLLAKAKEYRDGWLEYEEELAAWTPPPPEPVEEEEKEDDEEEDSADEKEDDEKGTDKKKKKKKKKDEEPELEPDPITGLWQAEVVRPPRTEASTVKLRVRLEGGEGSAEVTGNLRCNALSDTLVTVAGFWDREARQLSLKGLGSQGWLTLELTFELGSEEQRLVGTVSLAGSDLELSLDRASRDFFEAKRPERRSEKKVGAKKPKGAPKEPKVDAKLEPLRRAMDGDAAILVDVQREDEILACVDAFESVGIRPVLVGARDAHYVSDDLVDRVAGVLLEPLVVRRKADRGTDYITPYSELQNAGIPVAFHSRAEEGAIDLPLMAAFAVANGMSPQGALRALTADVAAMMGISEHVGRLERGLDADVLLLDGPPLAPGTSVLRVWVNGREVH